MLLCQAPKALLATIWSKGLRKPQKSPPEFWHLEPDRLDETLVCYDSRQPGSWDQADKELAQLIFEVAESKPHVVIILDCCHSGSGTRNVDEGRIRRIPTDERVRPLNTLIVKPNVNATLAVELESGWLATGEGAEMPEAAFNRSGGS